MRISKAKIICAMAAAGLTTYTQLAKSAGIHNQVLSNVCGRGTCTVATATKLARALGVDVSELMENNER